MYRIMYKRVFFLLGILIVMSGMVVSHTNAYACAYIDGKGVGIHKDEAQAKVAANRSCVRDLSKHCENELINVTFDTPNCSNSTALPGNKECKVTCRAVCKCSLLADVFEIEDHLLMLEQILISDL